MAKFILSNSTNYVQYVSSYNENGVSLSLQREPILNKLNECIKTGTIHVNFCYWCLGT